MLHEDDGRHAHYAVVVDGLIVGVDVDLDHGDAEFVRDRIEEGLQSPAWAAPSGGKVEERQSIGCNVHFIL